MCGIAGIVAQADVNQALYDALTVLQHRGQDAAGIVTCDGNKLHLRKGNGLVRDVFHAGHMRRLVGKMGIAHCRYPTAGSCSGAEAQPFYVNSPYGITLAHNGNLTNAEELAEDMFRSDLRHINTTSDSEVLLNVFAHELGALRKHRPIPDDLFHAVTRVHERCRGAYAVVVMIAGYGILAFRDPHGIRPLVYGSRHSDLFGTEYMIASESVALDALDFRFERDVAPGEAIFVDLQGKLHIRQCAADPQYCPCIFELVYLARPDSMIDGISVYKSRLRMGEKLAQKIMRERPDHGIDVVIPIPDSGRTCALEMAHELGVKFREGFVKNRYIGRTFIMPGQSERKKSVRKKLNPIELEFRDKVVCLVDDSLVRGTTSKQIIQMAREAGAKKVYFASSSPPVRYPNVYGIDMPVAEELIAHSRSVGEIAETIGADWLIYQDLEDLIDCARDGNPGICRFETSIFDHHYVTGDVDAHYLNRLHVRRSDSAKIRRDAETLRLEEFVDLHNSE